MAEGVYFEQMMKNPFPSSRSGKSGSTLLGVLTLLAVLCFVALIALQVLELMYYGAPESLWPG